MRRRPGPHSSPESWNTTSHAAEVLRQKRLLVQDPTAHQAGAGHFRHAQFKKVSLSCTLRSSQKYKSSKRGKEANTEKTGNPETGDARQERGQGVSGSHAPAPPEQEGREPPRTRWGIWGAGRVERELVLRS